jgi:hypothetical protein
MFTEKYCRTKFKKVQLPRFPFFSPRGSQGFAWGSRMRLSLARFSTLLLKTASHT